jgi:Domain of unknown function (DUF2017)
VPEVTGTADGVRVELADYEAQLLLGLGGEMRTLLEADVPSVDPVKARLFPRAYEDADDQRDYERLIGDDLLSAKRNALRVVMESLENGGPANIELDGERVEAWLSFLTDLRLAIGTRLEVDEDKMSAEVDPDDPDAAAMSTLHWLGLIQGLILEELEERTWR